MMIVMQHCLNTLETAVLYSLVACGFYLASISTRHFSFAAALGFLIAPYSALSFESGPSKFPMALLGLCLCGAFGFVYQRASSHMSKKGAREGQLLILSLATMGIGENIITLLFGSSSQTLSSVFGFPNVILSQAQFSGQQLADFWFSEFHLIPGSILWAAVGCPGCGMGLVGDYPISVAKCSHRQDAPGPRRVSAKSFFTWRACPDH